MHEIWTEKYRPKTLDEVVGQDEIVERLKSYVRSRNVPHLLLSGQPGVGKTACAIALSRDLFGEVWSDNFLELNASDERGIDTIREDIKEFARTVAIGAEFKIIFLDEADSLTSDAQSALRRTMERYSSTCRFILSVNYSSKIISPIQSRCAVYRFRPLSDDAIKAMINRIAKEEGLRISDNAIDAIIYISQKDMREAINAIQSVAAVSKEIEEDDVYQVTASARPEEVTELIKTAMKGEFDNAMRILNDLINQGLSGEDIIEQMHRAALSLDIPEDMKIVLVDKMGEADFRLTEGASERIQLEALIAHLALLARS